LNFALEVDVAPTVRELDGLALSSRNAYLQGDERRAALALSRALRAVEQAWRGGEADPACSRAGASTCCGRRAWRPNTWPWWTSRCAPSPGSTRAPWCSWPR